MNIPYPLDEIVKNELKEDEKVQWFSQPGSSLKKDTILGAILGLPITIIGIIWLKNVLNYLIQEFHYLTVFSLIVGAFIFYLGFVLVITPFFNIRNYQRTLYVITNKRAILFDGRGLLQRKIYSFGPKEIKNLKINRYNGYSDIILGRKFAGILNPTRRDIGFLKIKDVAKVEGLLKAIPKKT